MKASLFSPKVPGAGPGVAPSYVRTTIQNVVVLSGVTRDSTSAPLGNCTVEVFETGTNNLKAVVVSDASGNYIVSVAAGVQHYLVAYLPGSPDVAGTTVNTLVGA